MDGMELYIENILQKHSKTQIDKYQLLIILTYL